MVVHCKDCGGTGVVRNDKYCRCAHGKMKKVLDQSTAKAAEAKVVEDEKKAWDEFQSVVKLREQKKPTQKHTYKVGDWVLYNAAVCIVDQTTHSDVRIIVIRDDTGNSNIGASGWQSHARIRPAPIEQLEGPEECLINLALATGDKKWFNQLTKTGVTK